MKIIFKLMDFIVINHIRKNLIRHLFKYHIHLPFNCAEFGVYRGTTARYISKETSKTLSLFDSFDGLPEDWNNNFKKGDFKLKQIPKLPDNTKLYKGLFKETIPKFLCDYKKPLSFIHVDSDLYSSAKEILFTLNDIIIPGTVLLFDEYSKGENSALREWLNKYTRSCILLRKTIHLQAAYMVIN